MTNIKNIIGVDLGGTHIRAGKIIQGEITEIARNRTPAEGSEQEVLEQLIRTIDTVFDKNTVCIGVGVPSVVDVELGIVYDVVNIPSWKVVPLKEKLLERFKVPIFINNDSNCFAAGEKIYGKGKNFKHIVGMTMGTGLGLGLIIHGKLYEGRNCGAGEFGMVPYLDNVVETYCSGQFFSVIKNMDGLKVHQAALQGDQMAIGLFREFGQHVGIAMKSILYAYDPEIIIIGGSLASAFPLFRETMYDEIVSFAYRNTLTNLKIEVSEISDAAILGAAALQMGTIVL